MTHRSHFSIFSIVGVLTTAAFAIAARAVVYAYDACWDYGRHLFDLAFPAAPRLFVEGGETSPPPVLGRAQTRSYRSRLLARQSDDRTRAPLAAAFVTA